MPFRVSFKIDQTWEIEKRKKKEKRREFVTAAVDSDMNETSSKPAAIAARLIASIELSGKVTGTPMTALRRIDDEKFNFLFLFNK